MHMVCHQDVRVHGAAFAPRDLAQILQVTDVVDLDEEARAAIVAALDHVLCNAGKVDPERHAQVAAFLAIQEKEAQWWRDASIAYFQTFSKRPLPAGAAKPPRDLAYYESLQFPFAPGDGK